MKLNTYLSNRLKEVLTDGEWVVGTNFKSEISNLDWKDAIHKIDDFNTIADLTFHIHYYIQGVTKVLKGGPLDINDQFSFDAPLIASSQDWQDRINQFYEDSEIIIQLVSEMSEEKLTGNFVKEKYGSYHRNMDVMIEHTYYHLGQIILIKKRLNSLRH